MKITWVQRVRKFLHEISDPHSGCNHGEADQLHRKVEGRFLWTGCRVHQRHRKEATSQDQTRICHLHLRTLSNKLIALFSYVLLFHISFLLSLLFPHERLYIVLTLN